MENQNYKNFNEVQGEGRDNASFRSKHGRHRGNRGHGGNRGGAGQDIRTKQNQDKNDLAAQQARSQGTENGEHIRLQTNKGQQSNRQNAQHQQGGKRGRERDRRPMARNDAAHTKGTAPQFDSSASNMTENDKSATMTQSFKVTPSLSRPIEDKWLDDTFSPLHETEVNDPAAEAVARRILDEEGPLLFRVETGTAGQTVVEGTTGMVGGATGTVEDTTGTVEDTTGTVEDTTGTVEDTTGTVEVVGVRFKASGRMYYFSPGKLDLKRGTYAIVETARGEEYGEVCRANSHVPMDDVVQPLRPVLRTATEADAKHHEENGKKEQEAFRICQQKIVDHGLDMKLVEAQYTFDNSKLLFYFTSDGRVDFRELVKDLAGVFRTRIELRQIGIRDEAKLLGGLGTCGRPLCCSGFLPDFVQVSIKMAKEQNLSLNSTKISGCCGRLMCCLRYEYETYETEIRLTPPVGSTVETADGRGEVVANHPLKGTVTVRLADHADEPVRVYHRDGVQLCCKNRSLAKADAQDAREQANDSED